MRKTGLLVLMIAFAAVSCKKSPVEDLSILVDEPYYLTIPEGFTNPDIPEDNQLTKLRVELGKKLFFDKNLSVDGSISCGSCHLQEFAFSDGRAKSIGVDGRPGRRNSPVLFNLAWHDRLMADGGVPSIELQVMVPLHDELEMASNILDVSAVLNENEEYRNLAMAAYNRDVDPFVITRAIAAYERTLVSGNSRYDQFLAGNLNALSTSEKAGMDLFFSDRTSCSSCHGGFLLADNEYHNIGLSESYEDAGRELITLDGNDNGKFKTPTLRNIALTAPYMHDGSVESLEEVLDHFISGGFNHPVKDDRIRNLDITSVEKQSIIDFLGALTDIEFIENEEFRPRP